jgi:hypothetical protein
MFSRIYTRAEIDAMHTTDLDMAIAGCGYDRATLARAIDRAAGIAFGGNTGRHATDAEVRAHLLRHIPARVHDDEIIAFRKRFGGEG